MSFVTYDMQCPECDYLTEYTFDLASDLNVQEMEAIVNNSIDCPNCEEEYLQRAFVTPPSGKVAGTYEQNIASMKQSFHQKFMRPESQDQMRHVHGNLYDASLVGGSLDKATKLQNKAFEKVDDDGL